MNEEDRKRVEDAKVHGGTMGTKGRDLLELIERLDKQLAEVKEAGKCFVEAYNKHLSHLSGHPSVLQTDAYESAETQSRFMKLHQLGLGLSKFSRFAEALKGVKDE